MIFNFLDDDDLASQSMASNRSEESKLGFNMCECGFEGIAIKVAKRSSNQDEYPQELASGIWSANSILLFYYYQSHNRISSDRNTILSNSRLIHILQKIAF